MKALLAAIVALVCIGATSCQIFTDLEEESIGIIGGADGPTSIFVATAEMDSDDDGVGANVREDNVMYEQITPEEAKRIMDSGKEHIILDVREQDEYDAGHIPGAIVIPYTQIEQRAGELPADKGMAILVYCRSGRRSKIASESLAGLGYTNVKEFGGILDWEYEVEK